VHRSALSQLLDELSDPESKLVWGYGKMLQIRMFLKNLSIRVAVARLLLFFLIIYSLITAILFSVFLAGHPLLIATGVGLLASTYILGTLVDRLVLVLVGYRPY
jgi:hypothetical protein